MQSNLDEWISIIKPEIGSEEIEFQQYPDGLAIRGPNFAVMVSYPNRCLDDQLEISQVI